MIQEESYTTSIKLFQIIYNIIAIFQNSLCHIFEIKKQWKSCVSKILLFETGIKKTLKN